MELTAGTVGKGIAAIGGSGAGGYGIYALATGEQVADYPRTQEESSKQPESEQSNPTTSESLALPVPDFLFQVSGFGGTSGDYSNSGGSFGYAFGRFMLNPNANEEVWAKNKEKLNNYKNSDLHNVFKSAKSRINNKGLQQECEKIYKQNKQTVVTTGGWLGGIWFFCSVAEQNPAPLSESSVDEYTGKWALEGENLKGLFSTENLTSDKVAWKHVYENVLKKDIENESKKSSISSQFLAIKSETELYNTCKTAYKSNSTNTKSNYGDNVREYCALDASISLSKYPTEPGK